jgi:hypothetical protein
MKWSERRQKVRQIMRTVPHDQRRAAFKDSWFPPVVSIFIAISHVYL